MVVAGTTQIGAIEKRGGTAFPGRGVVRLAGEKGGDALAVEDAQFESAGRGRLRGEPYRGRGADAQNVPGRCGTPVRGAADWRARR